jgi:hypothetical protein
VIQDWRCCAPQVQQTFWNGMTINLTGLGATLLGLEATVGVLVAKTLTTATANPFVAGAPGGVPYNPVLAIDVFLVQVGAAVFFP